MLVAAGPSIGVALAGAAPATELADGVGTGVTGLAAAGASAGCGTAEIDGSDATAEPGWGASPADAGLSGCDFADGWLGGVAIDPIGPDIGSLTIEVDGVAGLTAVDAGTIAGAAPFAEAVND